MVTTDVIILAMNAFNDADKGDQEHAYMGNQSGAEVSTTEVEKPESSEAKLV
jgi:hypothetical protein